MWSSVLSGVLSGIIGALLGIYTSSKADERQEESLKMQATKDLIYKSQIEWYDDLRKAIAKLIEDFIQTNRILDEVERLDKRSKELVLKDPTESSLNEARGVLADLRDTRKEFENSFAETQGQIALIKLYLFKIEPGEADVLKEIHQLINSYYNNNKKIPLIEMDVLVEKTRALLKQQHDELTNKFK